MKIPERLETKRLILRQYTKEDINDFLKSYKVAEPGFSLVISSKLNDTYLGTCGLNPIKDSRNVSCVYALLPEFRHNGFAIEALLKLLEYAFIELELPKIITYIIPNNTDGWKVAERVGMKYMGQIQHNSSIQKVMLFIIEKEDYILQRSY